MKSSVRLESVVFQLTPTRTRCDLIMIANGKKEKIASGLLNPFLAHLKTAQDQIAKGGYSILLEPDPDSDAEWFTKGTMERFVRFVSTPEILERVYTIESEILQIEEAIAIQGNNDIVPTIVEEHHAKPAGSFEGNKSMTESSEEKAIVLYEPGVQQPETNSPSPQEGNSKVQLLKILENRKTVLQKEQGMAFARAVAAGFDIDHVALLITFAECFGAARLKDACSRFKDLWKKKHETGQWLEIEAAEAMNGHSDFTAMNVSGIMLSGLPNKQTDSNGEMSLENNVGSGMGANTGERSATDHQVPVGQQEYFQGQFPHPVFPPWSMHSPPGAVPVFQPYPMQGMPYYQAYSGNGPFYQPPYPPMDDSCFNVAHKSGHGRQSMDGKHSHAEAETGEMGTSKTRSRDVEFDSDASDGCSPRKKGERSRKNRSGTVVIRNINYITSKSKNAAGSESESTSGSETDSERDLQVTDPDGVQQNLLKSTKRGGRHSKSMEESCIYDNAESVHEKEADGGHWAAFQNYLLKGADEDNDSTKEDTFFDMEKDVRLKRRQNTAGNDPLALGERGSGETQHTRMSGIDEGSGNGFRILKRSNGDDIFLSRDYNDAGGVGQMIMQVDANGRKIISRTQTDEFMIGNRGNQSGLGNLSDPLAVNGFEHVTNKSERESSCGMVDESFIVPFRSMSLVQVGSEDRTIQMDSELRSTLNKLEQFPNGTRNKVSYEPDDLSLVPERRAEKRAVGYDPAFDYELIEGSATRDIRKNEIVTDAREQSKKLDKDRKSKISSANLDKKRPGGPIRKGKPSKASPVEDARARAERIRAFKADMQRIKREKEEADLKRIEALKLERQKRIAARGNSTSCQSPVSSLQLRKLPTKLSPLSQGRSKFSDSEPGSSSPLQRSKIRMSPLLSSVSAKAPKATKTGDSNQFAGNRLSRSVSSLPDTKKESNGTTPDSKASMERLRRLSEPKGIGNRPIYSIKARSAEPVSKLKLSNGPESKKISAIINLDKSKAASLPELKIRMPKGPSDMAQESSVAKDTEKTTGGRHSVTSEHAESLVSNAKASHQCDIDDNPIIEKTVVMLEKPSFPVVCASEENLGSQNTYCEHHGIEGKTEVAVEYAAIRAPPSPMDVADRDPVSSQVEEPSDTREARKNIEPSTKLANPSTVVYQVPYARVSSFEEGCTTKSEYAKASFPASSKMVTEGKESATSYVTDGGISKEDVISEAQEKTQVKESSKGFRRLLKFGKKSHTFTAADQSINLDKASTNGLRKDVNSTSSSREVYTLKNLISQDEHPAASNASQKPARHFSLLSPFRSKASERKPLEA